MISTTTWAPVEKKPATDGRVPNMLDYERSRAQFSWAKARRASTSASPSPFVEGV